MTKRLLTAGFCLVLAGFGTTALLAILTNSPGNYWLARGMFFSGSPHGAMAVLILYLLAPACIFWIVGRHLFFGGAGISLPSLGILFAATTASMLYFFQSWEVGLTHQGELVVVGLAVADATCVLILALLATQGRLHASTRTSFWFHWILALWISTLAFPYLGGVP